jgi:protein-S-isoprenylcysteine O-methyltransferase Ste14
MLNVPPPVWSLAYVLAATALSYWAGWPRVPGLPLVPLAVLLIVVGISLSVTAVVLFRREGTELNPASTTNRKLVTRGPFSFTRNAMYLAIVITTLGIAFWVGAWPMFLAPLAVFATANWMNVPFEEASMRRQFGAEFDAYVSRVRRWI